MTRPSPKKLIDEGLVDDEQAAQFVNMPVLMSTVSAAPVDTKPVKAAYAAVLSFLAIFLGAITTARAGGAEFDIDLFLVALYAALTGSGITGGFVYIKPNPKRD